MDCILGIDIGGSGIKGAPVDVASGEVTKDRVRIPTPKKSTPQNVIKICQEIVNEFKKDIGDSPVGIAIPGPVKSGKIQMMANLHKDWVGFNADAEFTEALGRPCHLVNDADAAGVGEVTYGAAKSVPGVVIVTTLGTGIGTAIINNGVLLPNTELGHLEIRGKDAESQRSAAVKEKHGWSYSRWAKKLSVYYQHLEFLFWPDLFVVGGGVSKDHEHFLDKIDVSTPIVPAKLRNFAGIIGAARFSADTENRQLSK